jgi:peptide/nickel transport system permease protein
MLSRTVYQSVRMVFSVFFVTLVVFVLLRLSGDPADLMLPFDATAEQRAALRHAYGWDKPIYLQYLRFLGRAVRGDFGLSLYRRQPALEVVLERIPATLELALVSMSFCVAIGIPAGVLTAVLKGTIIDYIAGGVAFAAQSMPSFWLGLMLILIFAVGLGWLPTSGRAGVVSRILPVITLSSVFMAEIMMLVRQGMIEALHEDYVRTARSKGLSENTVRFVHALRNVLIPVTTVIGMNFGSMLGGAVVTESVFAWPGMGRLAVEAIYSRDFPVVQAVILFLSSGIVLVNFVVDSVYGLLDPRVREAGLEG